MPETKGTVLEIDLKALTHNLRFLRSKLKKPTKFLAVVKAFAYGSDAVAIAKRLEQLHIDYFAVAYVSEGVALRNAGITTPILVLHPQVSDFPVLIERCLEPALYSKRSLELFLETAKTHQQKNYPVHIKFNTGLNRLGFRENELIYVLEKLSATNTVRIHSVFSHLAASEDTRERTFTLNQIAAFKKIAGEITAGIGYRPLWHLLNTSGILHYAPEAQFDMVRSGIGLYGFGNAPEHSRKLRPIATLKSIISQIHSIEKGESIGYNRAHKAAGAMRTATLPIGHADGIGRHFGKGKGFVTIHGKKAPIVGNVCMDMLMADVTEIDCKEGDEVIIFDSNNSAETLAENAGTIAYELLTAVSQRVRRIIIE